MCCSTLEEYEHGHNGIWNKGTINCQLCGGPAEYQGTLGKLDWYRCLACGHWIDKDIDKEAENEENARQSP